MKADQLYLRPLDVRGKGSGHFRRSYSLACELHAANNLLCTLIVDNPDSWAREIPGFPGEIHTESFQNIIPDTQKTTLILSDMRNTSLFELQHFSRFGMPVLLDDDGPSRLYAPFVIDSIPGPRQSAANISSASLLNLPPPKRMPNPDGEILISFGGQDPHDLSIPVLDFLINVMNIERTRISVTLPAGAWPEEPRPLYNDVKVIEAPENLKEKLHQYGMVFCSFGLTAFEALAAGCGVITVNPGPYHSALSEFTGFPGITHTDQTEMRLSRKQSRRLKTLLGDPETLMKTWNGLSKNYMDNEDRQEMSHLIQSINVVTPVCAACGALLPEVIARFCHRSYYRCRECRMLGLYLFETREVNYGHDYFGEEYRQQYGRTYLEDFDTIKAMGHSRLRLVKKYRPEGSLLDIGCAFGPFLQAAEEDGFEVYGTDISEVGINHVKNVLGYPVLQGQFPEINPAEEFNVLSFDVVSLWYVIEHFPQLHPVLSCLSTIISPGGILAFSTPNASGVSARLSLTDFLENSPDDHYTLWSPRSAKLFLKKYGFKVLRTRVTGHHPERFFKGVGNRSILYRILMIFSKLFRLGDTFEVYAIKKNGD